MFTIEIQGTKQVMNKIKKIAESMASDDIKEYIAKKAIEVINAEADANLSYDKNYREHNQYKINGNSIIIYNDVQNENNQYYSLIIEYGSGLYAEKEHIGETETFVNTGYMYWFVPEEEAPDLFEYPYERIETEDGVFYKVYGQTPKHIYENSAKIIEKNLSKWIREYSKKELGGKL